MYIDGNMTAKACGKNEFRNPKTGRCKWRWLADGEVYNVRDFLETEASGDWSKGYLDTIPEGWHEYRVWLIDLKKNAKVVDEWNSQVETYLPGQELRYNKARSALKEIKDDINVKHKDPEYWFSPVRE